jgi:hypothetical protein
MLVDLLSLVVACSSTRQSAYDPFDLSIVVGFVLTNIELFAVIVGGTP